MRQFGKYSSGLFLVSLMICAGCSLSDPYTCKPNSQRCDATLGFQICDANGEWGSHYACTQCDGTKCADTSLAECDQNGQFKCIVKDDVSIALTCTNNHWIPLGCNSGICSNENRVWRGGPVAVDPLSGACGRFSMRVGCDD